jgi:sugar phosphate isomerase/epimerase
MLTRRAILAAPLVVAAAAATRGATAASRGKMQLCMHTNTSNTIGYRRAMEGWAKAGIKYVELNGPYVDEFLKTESIATARKVLDDNGLTAVHGALGMATLPTALRIVRDAAHPNFGVLFDFYHFWSGNSRLEDMNLLKPGEIFHVHFQDVPDMPREMLDMFSRNIPSDGISPLNAMLTKLASVGYAGPLSVELFLPRLTMGDPEQVAREIREKAEPVMAKAGVL